MELDVGGTKIKGVWIAILFSFASTIGGGIWAASEFFSRLSSLEETVGDSLSASSTVNTRFEDFRDAWTDDKKTITNDIAVLKQQFDDNDIGALQGKLATLGTNLETIMQQQQSLLLIQERVVEVEKQITQTEVLVTEAKVLMTDAEQIETKLNRIQKEIDDIWQGMDYLSNPYGN